MIEKKLEELFDYQRFERNGKFGKLDQLIRETENRYAGELSDDELGMVNAAGETGSYMDPVEGTFPENIPVDRFAGGLDRIRSKVFGSDIGEITGDFVGNFSENNNAE